MVEQPKGAMSHYHLFQLLNVRKIIQEIKILYISALYHIKIILNAFRKWD